MKEQLKNGAKAVGVGLVYTLGIAGALALSVIGAGVEEENKKNEGEAFKNVMQAIVESSLSGYYQKEIIEHIANKQLTEQQNESIIAICKSEMADYYKYESILKIVS